jgi:rhodanese-related sulfurtransferase
MKRIVLLIALLFIVGLGGCMIVKETNKIVYKTITQVEAKEIIDTTSDYIILDVRTLEEFNTGHIPNAINIPNEVILDQAESMLTNKEQVILVYCRSGRRSKEAASKLVDLGYSNVLEFGGIIDWKYEIE